ncbi:hypothetical protein P691DRAFT_757942 [Macrolepiota fuliginosa MF-IS2]|uniref:Globin-sensor domain-containing protein n=1 Tax=Macrolepiota fuliginosa MF-IS2 TaxID=1400762 RepID=A0A9P5XFZ9_9AGAR|nr:hypothetical protein P691DRAFT_757942 [Macrolepiota fuliginosa MF-IS2]
MHIVTPSSLESLPTRVTYARDFAGFTAEDAAALYAAKPYLAPLIPAVVDVVYVKLFEYDITAQAFVPRQTGYTGDAPTALKDVTLDHPQIKFRKDFLAGYIAKLVTMDYDDIKTWEYLDKVGRMRTGVTDSGFRHRAKTPGLRVEYIYCGLLLGFVEDIFVSAVMTHPELDQGTKLAVVKSVNKNLWLQNDPFARHYIEERTQPLGLIWRDYILPFTAGIIAISLLRPFRVFN